MKWEVSRIPARDIAREVIQSYYQQGFGDELIKAIVVARKNIRRKRHVKKQMIKSLLDLGITVDGEIKGPYDVIVPLSGGKDSQACLKLALEAHPAEKVLALFCDTQFEHPLTYQHVKKITDGVVDLITLNAGSVLSVCLKLKRSPGGGSRHCTDRLKIRPSKFFYKFLSLEQGGFEVWYGMRAVESKAREIRYEHIISDELYNPNDVMNTYPKYLAKQGVMFKLPILEWSTEEVFDLLDGAENPLYDMGFARVGCFPCLAGGECQQVQAFNFDATGKKHYKIAEEISKVSGHGVLTTKKYKNKGPGCAVCEI